MKAEELKNKKITMATLKSFIRKNDNLFVEVKYDFDGMTDGIRNKENRSLKPVTKEKAIGFEGVYCVGDRDYFEYKENETHFGIEVYNCCGCNILWTNK